MAIRKLLVVANTDNTAKEIIKDLGFTKYRSTPAVENSTMLSAEEKFESPVLLARKIIRIDDELTRRGFRPIKWKDEGYVYVHKTFGARAWMRVEDNETLSVTVFVQEVDSED